MLLTTKDAKKIHKEHKELKMSENEISTIVFDCGLKVHKNLGPRLLESA